jgi:MFS family permease
MNQPEPTRGKWLALTAALLGWMFDGLEMGLFSLVGRPALQDLLPGAAEDVIGRWFSVAMAVFLVGAAAGGVLFGWLGDKLGRVRAMMLSVLAYALFTGLCGLAHTAEQVMVLRFLAALGMGGEWSLGVALVTEIWPDRSRAFLAGLIGAAANVGFLLIAVFGLGLGALQAEIRSALLNLGLSQDWVNELVRWRLLMIVGALPALLSLFIQFFVPESERWQREQKSGATSNWAARDLTGIAIGIGGAVLIIYLWAEEFAMSLRITGTILGLAIVTAGFTFPVIRYLQRSQITNAGHTWKPTLGRMLLGAGLSGVALLGTWGSIQWAPFWADKLTEGATQKLVAGFGLAYSFVGEQAKEWTQICSGLGAIVGTLAAAWMGNWVGRRPTYIVLCLTSLASSLLLFQGNEAYGVAFLVSAFLAGGFTASFYGWLPLYLPELFRTGVRATGQGFSYNFGRVLAAIGALQTGNLMVVFKQSVSAVAAACSVMSLIYLVGLGIIWLAPETRGQPLPD